MIASMLAARPVAARICPPPCRAEVNLARARASSPTRALPESIGQLAAASLTKTDHKWRKQEILSRPRSRPSRRAASRLCCVCPRSATDDQWQTRRHPRLLPRAAATEWYSRRRRLHRGRARRCTPRHARQPPARARHEIRHILSTSSRTLRTRNSSCSRLTAAEQATVALLPRWRPDAVDLPS
jgi:hypothetical protein